jgi:glutaredoxin
MKATMYSKITCPYCVKALEILEENGIKVTEIKVNKDISPDDFKSKINDLTGKVVTTVPQIFIDDQYIGGCDDLVEHFNKKEVSEIDFSDFDI